MEKPSIRFSNNGSIASGVTSRPVKPVPPVVMMASTPSSAIHRLTMTRIASTSCTMISRAARLCPAATIRSASVAPDLSSASERVSEIVSTAMLSGTNCLASSIELMSSRGLQRCSAKRVARLQGSLLIAGHEPSLALFRRTMSEGIRHHAPRRLALQGVVADRGRGRERALDIARLDEARTLLLLAIGPDAGETIRLQFHPHLKRVGSGLAAGRLLLLRHARSEEHTSELQSP